MMLTFDPPVIAHRGMSANAPENTMAAFTRVVQAGIQWVEFDVMLAACGTPVVIHDETLERTTGHAGSVGDFPYSYLSTLDAGGWFQSAFSGERIPAFAQVMEFLADTKLCANIEIKPLPLQEERTVVQALQVLKTHFPENSPSLLFSSFSHATLHELRKHAPTCQLGLLMHAWQPDWREFASALNCVSVHVNQEILTATRAAEIKTDNKILLSYTVNDVDRAEALFASGVDAVFSDCPDRIARFGR